MSEHDTTLTVTNEDLFVRREPSIVLAEAQKAAKALQEVISKKPKPVIMNGEQYLEFEDWQTVARFYAISAKVVETKYVEMGDVKGFEAKAMAVRTDTGMEISGAEAMCLNDEKNWTSKPLFQLKSMAQTRACAKALRNVLSWVVVLAGYRPTPAEEMESSEATKPQGSEKESNGKAHDVLRELILKNHSGERKAAADFLASLTKDEFGKEFRVVGDMSEKQAWKIYYKAKDILEPKAEKKEG